MVAERGAKIRAERHGPVEPLTPRVMKFVEDRLGGRSLDDAGDVEKRPDFECLNGLLAIEIKTLETPPIERIENALKTEKAEADWPVFYGTWPIDSILQNRPNAKDLQKKLLDRLGRALVTHVKKANDQLGHHTARSPRRNLVRLLILLNEDHPEYSPEVVGFLVHRELRRMGSDGNCRNDQIDAVIYITERHLAPGTAEPLLPLTLVLGPGSDDSPWKEEVAHLILRRWAAWNHVPIRTDEQVSAEDFISAEHVPDKMKRHEVWGLEYRRAPYMRAWRDDEVRDLWDYVMLLNILWGHNDTPMKIPMNDLIPVMEQFTHLREEVATRGLSLDYFSKDSAPRLRAAADKLPYGPMVTKWLVGILDQRGKSNTGSAE